MSTARSLVVPCSSRATDRERARPIRAALLSDGGQTKEGSRPRQRMATFLSDMTRISTRSQGWRWRESNPRPMTWNQGFSGCSP